MNNYEFTWAFILYNKENMTKNNYTFAFRILLMSTMA